MSTETTRFVFIDAGSGNVVAGIKGIGNASREADTFVTSLQGALAALAGAFAINKLREYSDTWASVSGRLKISSKDAKEAAQSQQDLLRISNETRTSFEATASFYSRLAIQSKRLGISSKELKDVVRTVNQAMVISGTTANEAKGGLLQFAQGLATGRLQGEELRSVLENLPRLAQVIAEGMGTTVDKLKDMGAKGELTTTKILSAIRKGAPDIAKEFAKMPITIGQALTVLENMFLAFIGQTSETSGAVKVISDALIFLAMNMQQVASAAAILLAAMGAFAAVKIVASFAAFAAAGGLIAAPIALAIAALAGFAVWAATYGKDMVIMKDSTLTWGQALTNVVEFIKSAASTAFTFLKNNIDLVVVALKVLGAYIGGMALASIITGVVTAVRTLRTALIGLAIVAAANPLVLLATALTVIVGAIVLSRTETGSLAGAWKGLMTLWGNAVAIFNGVVGGIQQGITNLVANWQAAKDAVQAAWDGLVSYLTNLWNTITSTITNAASQVGSAFSNAAETVKSAFQSMYQTVIGWLSNIVDRAKQALGFASQAQAQTQTKGAGSAAPMDDLQKFATGGRFTVGGSGGTDSQTVAFNATPGEIVTVNTPGNARSSGGFTTVVQNNIRGFDEVVDSGKGSFKELQNIGGQIKELNDTMEPLKRRPGVSSMSGSMPGNLTYEEWKKRYDSDTKKPGSSSNNDPASWVDQYNQQQAFGNAQNQFAGGGGGGMGGGGSTKPSGYNANGTWWNAEPDFNTTAANPDFGRADPGFTNSFGGPSLASITSGGDPLAFGGQLTLFGKWYLEAQQVTASINSEKERMANLAKQLKYGKITPDEIYEQADLANLKNPLDGGGGVLGPSGGNNKYLDNDAIEAFRDQKYDFYKQIKDQVEGQRAQADSAASNIQPNSTIGTSANMQQAKQYTDSLEANSWLTEMGFSGGGSRPFVESSHAAAAEPTYTAPSLEFGKGGPGGNIMARTVGAPTVNQTFNVKDYDSLRRNSKQMAQDTRRALQR